MVANLKKLIRINQGNPHIRERIDETEIHYLVA